MTPILIDGGDDLPLTIAEVRTALRIEHDSEDSVIERSLRSAMEFFEEETNRPVTPGVYEIALDDWPCGPVCLERGPVRSVEPIGYLPADGGAEVELDATLDLSTRSDGLGELRVIGGWPTGIGLASRTGNVRIRFAAGYTRRGATDGERRFTLPAKAEQALILLTGHWFENREESSDRDNKAIILGAERIMRQMRIWR